MLVLNRLCRRFGQFNAAPICVPNCPLSGLPPLSLSAALQLSWALQRDTSYPSYIILTSSWHVMVWSSEALVNQQDIWIFLETFEAEAEVWVNKRLLWYGWILSLFQKYVLARAGSADSTCHLQYIENILDTISRPAQMYSLHYTLYRHPQSSQRSGVDIAYWCLPQPFQHIRPRCPLDIDNHLKHNSV